MNEFFKFLIRFFRGWKRKIGLLLLVMALSLMVGWVRIFSTLDKAMIPISPSETIEFSSLRSRFCLMRRSEPLDLRWDSNRVEQASDHSLNDLSADWSLQVGGLRLFSNLHAVIAKTMGIVVPY